MLYPLILALLGRSYFIYYEYAVVQSTEYILHVLRIYYILHSNLGWRRPDINIRLHSTIYSYILDPIRPDDEALHFWEIQIVQPEMFTNYYYYYYYYVHRTQCSLLSKY